MTIKDSLEEVRANIKKAKEKCPFIKNDVLLVCVTKTIEATKIKEAVDLGEKDLGENRVQELLSKYDELPGVNWHLIGHLQTNKVKYIVDKVKLIHSLDSIDLAKEIEKRAASLNIIVPALVQVNIADEDTKFGLREEDVKDFLIAMSDFPHLKISGLMTIGPFLPDPEDLRPVFRSLRLLSQRMTELSLPHIELKHLSMGMSNDYQVAIEEGADIIRVGSSIFGKR